MFNRLEQQFSLDIVPSDIIIYAMYSFNWTKNRSVQILIGMQEDGRQQDEWPCHASGHAF